MFPSTPPATNLSRSRLKALAKWVRDELDLLVAREGPNVLRPDDVLILHETFIALRLATNVTALDLRATGIHLAVQDIAGVATRWPGRLCDDCDKIMSIWTAKFGSLKNLHPFMYGRGGRLEGIAGPTEYSREALLKRWSEQCPEKLHPRRSHRLGDLGFKAGDWWINTLFAHHAGIIGLEAVEGGTTFDQHCAYALVLKDTGEVEACHGDSFTYRVPQGDKGKFRLTAATPRSRYPIRVLRSHSINSVWGPKAGVRYEGLFAVRGWSIRQAKTTDTTGGHWKEGDILFEVRMERKDVIPFTEVTNRPTATEVDDYTEYKRLRKLHRHGKRNVDLNPDLFTQPHSIAALPITQPPIPPKILRKGSPTKPTFKHPHFDLPKPNDMPTPADFKRTDTDYFSTPTSPRKGSTLTVPAGETTYRPPSPRAGSISSGHTGASTALNIHEVAPWIDFDAELNILQNQHSPSPSPSLSSSRNEVSTPRPSLTTAFGKWGRKQGFVKESPLLSPMSGRRKSGDSESYLSPARAGSKRDVESSRKSIFVRTKNPMAKLFDGAAEMEEEERGSRGKKDTSTSSDGTRVLSPVPRRPFGQESAFAAGRRGVLYTSDGQAEDKHEDKDDPFIEPSTSFPQQLISRPKITVAQVDEASLAHRVQQVILVREVLFRLPYWGSPAKGLGRDSLDIGVAPDAVE